MTDERVRQVRDEARRLYALGHSSRRVGFEVHLPYRQVLAIVHDIVRRPGPRPRLICCECGKPAWKFWSNKGSRRSASGTRCRFHQRLHWAATKAAYDARQKENGGIWNRNLLQ